MAKNKDETEWVEPLSPECQQWWAAARPKAWWVILIPYALWHMLLEGFWEWERVQGEKHRNVEGWRGARGGGEGVLLTYRSVNGGKELLTSPNAHTLQKDTTPSSWRQRESTERKQGGTERGRQETKTQGKTGVRYCRNSCIWVLRLHRQTRQQGRTSTVFYIQHTNLIVTHRQTCQTQAEQENDDIDEVTERKWGLKGDRRTFSIRLLSSVCGGGFTAGWCWGWITFTCVSWPDYFHNGGLPRVLLLWGTGA